MSLLERARRSDFAFLLCVCALQAAVITGPFALHSALFNDTLGSYGLFYDNLDSLNRFGEPAWWASHVNLGTPTYFFGLLGIPNLGKPAFASLGSLAWILGRLGLPLPFVYPLYVFYLGVLVPFLFLVGVWLVAREVLRSRAARRYCLAAAAFSPAMLMNLGDPGVTENAAYGLVTAAAYLRFVALPTRARFWALSACALLVSVAASSAVMVSAAPVLGVLVVASLLASRAARRALRSVRPVDAIATAALLLATASPSLIAFAQQRDQVVSRTVGSLGYPFGALKSGNPLVFLLPSVPVPMAWDAYQQDPAGPLSQLQVRSLGGGERVGSTLGLMALPLAAVGFVFGRRRVRVPLLAMLVLAGAVLVMFASSPLLAPILWAFPVLGSYNHFGDELYDGCGFLVLLFAAGLGLEAAQRQPGAARWLAAAFAGSVVVSLSLLLRWGEPPAALAGFLVLMAACFALLLAWVRRLPASRSSSVLASGVVALTLLDQAVVCVWSARPVLRASSHVSDAGLGTRIGSGDPDVNVTTENYALATTDALTAAGVDLALLPYVAGFCTAHVDGVGTGDAMERFRGGSLALPASLRSAPGVAGFLAADPGDCRVEPVRVTRSYNAIQLRVRASRPSLVFVKDGWSPYWRASVNGAETDVFPALGAFKAVAVPAGVSAVRLRFAPPWVGAAWLTSYALLVGVGLAVWLRSRVGSRGLGQHSTNAV